MKRRDFIRCLTVSSTAGLATSALATSHFTLNTPDNNTAEKEQNKAKQSSVYGSFTHGVASGDPLANRVIIWTRFVPDSLLGLNSLDVVWEVALDKHFKDTYSSGVTLAHSNKDFIVKVDVEDLKPNKTYYYRFSVGQIKSAVGVTKTLAKRNVKKVRFAIATCANHPAGYFNAYAEISRQHKKAAYDALLHIGDYIYEYGMGEYASEHAIELDRVPSPAHECVTLSDYRKRYAQYRSDPDLQTLHAQMPFIHIWDDHEIADNTWKEGALNHQPQEGEFIQRRKDAIQAFHEWLPIRDNMVEKGEIYRSFVFGDLVHLLMLDTRVTGRSKQLDYSNYSKSDPDAAYDALQKDLYASDHHLLGAMQKKWIKKELAQHQTRWTTLGQQVLMTKMNVPFNLLLAVMGAKEAKKNNTYFDPNIVLEAAKNPSLLMSPYNLDAWDGYPRDREWLYSEIKKYNKSLVSFAGDTHNAWAGHLLDDKRNNVGIEFASHAIGSPGFDHYLPKSILQPLALLMPELIEDLEWTNLSDRGFMSVTFTEEEVTSDWIFIDSILKKDYKVINTRSCTSEDGLDLDFDDNEALEAVEDFIDELTD